MMVKTRSSQRGISFFGLLILGVVFAQGLLAGRRKPAAHPEQAAVSESHRIAD